MAGKQLNFDDERSALFFEYIRLLKEINPKYFLLENVKMKKEYEDVNGTIREKDGMLFNNVDIPEQNPIQYINIDEFVDILNNKSGIVFLSSPTCPYCRASISSLCSLQKSSKASVVLLASSIEKPLDISVSSPGISVLTNPAARISRYRRASAWFASGATKPFRSLLGSLVLMNGGRILFSNAS